MTDAKHTPGPWGSIAEVEGHITITGPDGYGIAEVDVADTFKRGHDGVANVHLIAAAPDLLKALEVLYAYAKEMGEGMLHQPTGGSKVRAQVEAAIRKARGEVVSA